MPTVPFSKMSLALAMSVFGCHHGHADGMELLHLRIHHVEDDVQVVDHQVEDHVHVRAPRGEDIHPVGLEEKGFLEQGLHLHHGGVEALDQTDLEHEIPLRGHADERIGRVQLIGDRLLDQQVDARWQGHPCATSKCISVGTARLTASTCSEQLHGIA